MHLIYCTSAPVISSTFLLLPPIIMKFAVTPLFKGSQECLRYEARLTREPERTTETYVRIPKEGVRSR